MNRYSERRKKIEGDIKRNRLISGHFSASLILQVYQGGIEILPLILLFTIILFIPLISKGELIKSLNRDTPFLIVILMQVIFFFWAAFTYQIYILLLIYGIGSIYSIYSPFFREKFSKK